MSAAVSFDAASGTVDMVVGYTDPMIGVTSWPVTSVAWGVTSAAEGQAGARLQLRIAMQPGGLTAGGTVAGDAAAATAADIGARFGAIWYQIMQPDVTAALSTSLDQPAAASPTALPVPMDGLRAHVSACYAFSTAAALMGASLADPTVTPTLADVVTRYGLDWQALGLAAGERPVGHLVTLPEAGLAVPDYVVFTAGSTVTELVPKGLDPAAVLGDDDNIVLPLLPGTELVIPAAEHAQPADGLSAGELAEAFGVTLASLTTANMDRPALLAPGFVFSAQGIEVEVPATGEPGADATLDDISATFRDNGVPYDAVMTVGANAAAGGMFRPGVTLTVDRKLIRDGWTLDDNDTGQTAATLAGLNIDTIDLFPAGAPLFLKTTSVTGLADAPLGATARAYGVEPGDLLRHNAGLAPQPPSNGNGLPIPGLSAWPQDPTTIRIPWRILGGAAMTAITARFVPLGSDAEVALTQANRAMPGTVAGGRTITVDGQALATEAGDSFDAVIARADPPVTIDAFAAAIADDPDALATGGLLLCGPALTGDAALTPPDLGARYGLDPTLILSANAATPGVIVAGLTLRPSPVAATPTITTATGDSLNAIIRRFAAAGIAVTIGDVVTGNADQAWIAAAAKLLLPPADTRLEAGFGTGGWQFPDVIFPLRTWITLARDPRLVDPAFLHEGTDPGPVAQVASPIAVTRSAAPEREEDGAVTLDVFAAAIEGAIDGLKIATGKVLSAERDPAPTDVWAVSFVDPGGITKVDLAPPLTVDWNPSPQPWSFGLRPLSNTLEAESGVTISTLDPTTGTWGKSQTYDFQGIDLEVWARSWLAGLDLICTAPYAAPAYRVNPTALESILGAKKLTACAVADGLSAILAEQDTGPGAINGAGWKAAREVLYQRLLRTLGAGYDTTAVLQFAAEVTAPAAAATARLSGAGKLSEVPVDGGGSGGSGDGDPNAWRVSQLGNAKLPLKAAPADAKAPVSFTLDVSQPALHRSVRLKPVYAVNEIEFGITPVDSGYDASNWLTFVLPFETDAPPAFSADLDTPQVPVPLRAYPDLPALISQTATTPADPHSVAEAVHWAYVFTYTHQSADQDQIRIELEFNRQPDPALRAMLDEDETLFALLAQYASASDTFWQILAGLQAPAAGPGDTVLAATLDTYATLAGKIATRWAAWWGVGSCDDLVAARSLIRPAHEGLVPAHRTTRGRAALLGRALDGSEGPVHSFFHYLATLNTTVVGITEPVQVYATLTLQQLGDEAVPFDWPEILVIRDDGATAALTGREPTGAMRIYDFPLGDGATLMPAFSRLSFRYTIGGLHIAAFQNATAGVSVIRNARLLGAEGPETGSAFVYRTPQLGFPEPLVPLITVQERIDIGAWTTDPATNPLTAVFNEMFDGQPAGQQIAVSIRYGYTLVQAGPDSIETLLPVLLHPRYDYSSSTVSGIIQAVGQWQRATQPVTTGAVWGFSISLYSTTDPDLDRPLLELQKLVSAIG
ncbi:hypothetical protein P7L70_04605 (plasmid) [Tistrella mobilis]|uniref:hypothetical protein n=1 Tax=Tistrella mobilis TaxID=171437 RepID=UPI0035566C46